MMKLIAVSCVVGMFAVGCNKKDDRKENVTVGGGELPKAETTGESTDQKPAIGASTTPPTPEPEVVIVTELSSAKPISLFEELLYCQGLLGLKTEGSLKTCKAEIYNEDSEKAISTVTSKFIQVVSDNGQWERTAQEKSALFQSFAQCVYDVRKAHSECVADVKKALGL